MNRHFSPLALILALAVPGLDAQEPETVPTGRVRDLCVVPWEQVSTVAPVRVKGVVTAVMPSGGDPRERTVFTFHDGSAGIFVVAGSGSAGVEWTGDDEILGMLAAGVLVEVEGILERGAFKPNIVATGIKVIGESELPAPKRVSPDRLMSGAEVTERVETSGVMVSCTRFKQDTWLLRLDSHGGYFFARIRCADLDARPLVDAEVRIRGVVASAYNGRSEFVRPNIWVDGPEDLIVVKPAPLDAFSVPKVDLASLDGFSIEGRSLHRRRVEGTVSYCEPGSFLYLQEGTRAIKVGLQSEVTVEPGDRIEASGFLDITGPVAGLRGAVVTKLGDDEALRPLPTSLAEIIRSFEPVTRGLPSSPHDFDGLLVEVTGRLLSVQRITGRQKARLLMGGENQLMTADLEPSVLESLGDLRVGSLLKVSGVADVEYAASRQVQELSQPVGLNLLVRGAEDVVVMDAASWWTPHRLGLAATLLGVILAGVLVWSFALQLQLRKRTSRLEEVMKVHRDQELEFRGARHERQRLAADMHDGVQQLIAGAAFRLEAAETHLTETSPMVDSQLAAARSALLRAQEGLRDCLTGMLHVDEGPAEFPALLRYAADAMDHWPSGLVEVQLTGGQTYPLSRHVKGNLLMLMQEAVGNAIKHGGARQVTISLGYHDEDFEMLIEDDGKGFDSHQARDHGGGHYGLDAMRHRMSWLGGTVEFLSSGLGGVMVCARMPRPQDAPAAQEGSREDGVRSGMEAGR